MTWTGLAIIDGVGEPAAELTLATDPYAVTNTFKPYWVSQFLLGVPKNATINSITFSYAIAAVGLGTTNTINRLEQVVNASTLVDGESMDARTYYADTGYTPIALSNGTTPGQVLTITDNNLLVALQDLVNNPSWAENNRITISFRASGLAKGANYQIRTLDNGSTPKGLTMSVDYTPPVSLCPQAKLRIGLDLGV
jgi:hypothetical protein